MPGPADGRPLRLLMVDDDPLARLLTGKCLERLGHRVVPAADAKEALQRAGLDIFDVVLLDIHLPESDGFEIARALRAGGSATPIIGLTGDEGVVNGQEWARAGMNGCLHKPFNVDAFWEALRVAEE